MQKKLCRSVRINDELYEELEKENSKNTTILVLSNMVDSGMKVSSFKFQV